MNTDPIMITSGILGVLNDTMIIINDVTIERKLNLKGIFNISIVVFASLRRLSETLVYV